MRQLRRLQRCRQRGCADTHRQGLQQQLLCLHDVLRLCQGNRVADLHVGSFNVAGSIVLLGYRKRLHVKVLRALNVALKQKGGLSAPKTRAREH